MKVLVDTSVWSLAFRRSEKTEAEKGIVALLTDLVKDTNVILIGPIRQEILSGILSKDKFYDLKDKVAIFKDHALVTEDFVLAAEYYNVCRSNGIQGSHTDFLLCAFSVNHQFPILTLDKDFYHYKKYIPIITMKIQSI